MGVVRKFCDPNDKRVGVALEILMAKHKAGKLPALLFIGEELGTARPLYGMVGRFRADPTRAIGHLAVVKRKVIEMASDGAPEVEDPA
jgi:hypothetical protein